MHINVTDVCMVGQGQMPQLCKFGKLIDMSKVQAVVFDIDGTLSPDVSWLALTRDLGASVERHVQLYTDYKNDNIDYPTSKAQLIELWRATGNANKTFFTRLFDALPLDPVAEEVSKVAKMGRTVCLITGSMDLYAETVARKLGIEHGMPIRHYTGMLTTILLIWTTN